MYKVEERDLVKDIQGFPIEVVQKMLEYQVSQGNKEDVSIFQNRIAADKTAKGFDWKDTEEGMAFWNSVINKKKFDIFFNKYPKQLTEQTSFKYLYIKCTSKDSKNIIQTLKQYGGKNTTGLEGRVTNPSRSLYYIDQYQNIRYVMNDWDPVLYELILKNGKEIKPENLTDVYYHGDPERGPEIIKALEKLGGNNDHFHFDGIDKSAMYYISRNSNEIRACDNFSSELASFITHFYTKLTLPPVEIIEIEGKKYKREEVLDKLKDLKTY